MGAGPSPCFQTTSALHSSRRNSRSSAWCELSQDSTVQASARVPRPHHRLQRTPLPPGPPESALTRRTGPQKKAGPALASQRVARPRSCRHHRGVPPQRSGGRAKSVGLKRAGPARGEAGAAGGGQVAFLCQMTLSPDVPSPAPQVRETPSEKGAQRRAHRAEFFACCNAQGQQPPVGAAMPRS